MAGYRYQIHGFDNQLLEVQLEPGQRIQAEKGAMTWMSSQVRMNTRFGERSGFRGAIRRKLSSESLLINEFTNESNDTAVVALSAEKPSHIMRTALNPQDPAIICKQDAFLAGDTGIDVSWTKGSAGAILLARGALIMQRLQGDGEVFLTGNGAVVNRTLGRGETLLCDLDALVALQDTVEYSVRRNRGLRNMLWSGEGIFVVELSGPGSVWLQSLSRFEVASAHIKALIKHEAEALNKRR